MYFILIISFFIATLITYLFQLLLFQFETRIKLLLNSLDTSLFIWLVTLFSYTNVLGHSIAFEQPVDRLTYFLTLFTTTIVVLLLKGYYKVKRKQTEQLNTKSRFLIKDYFFLFIYALIIFFSTLLYSSSVWLINLFGPVSVEQLLYNVQNLSGSSNEQVFSYINGPLMLTIFITYLFMKIYVFSPRPLINLKSNNKFYTIISKCLPLVLILLVLSSSIFLSLNQVGIAQVKLYFQKSNFLEVEYADPNNVQLQFPEKKRNLIYIFVESFESSYTDNLSGGTQKHNLLEDLTVLLGDDAINFSNTEGIGGALQVPGAEYTAAGIVSQTSGMPLKVPSGFAKPSNVVGFDIENNFGMDENYTSGESSYLPGLTSIGDILQKKGYNQTFVMGSDATFGGRRSYLTQHGNYDILDTIEAKNRGYIPEDYKVWWGYEDTKLFDFSKTELASLSKQEAPFNLTLLTADTHFPDGLLTEDTPTPYDNQYANVISYTSKQIADFLIWCRQQDFYENTTIVISGDHLTMDQKFVADFPKNYERTIFNMFVNAPITTENSKNRTFTSMDMFPTTLASLNVAIPGDRLGIGTNLFSDRITIAETHSIETLRENLTQKSEFYEKNILQEALPAKSSSSTTAIEGGSSSSAAEEAKSDSQAQTSVETETAEEIPSVADTEEVRTGLEISTKIGLQQPIAGVLQ
ncbi:LTA synthase family protein [Enterococcus sp. LJL128]